MVKPELVQEQPVPLAEVKEELERIKARDGQLGFRATKCEEYLQEFSLLGSTKTRALQKKIAELEISRIKFEHVTMIVDLMPKTADDVKLLFQGATVSLTRKDYERIAEAVQQVE
ncbi:hypothetical protein J4207_02280 [Candidatus Woesearchaeota archaeon]|nr:hypothetical protein [Candidatus Woesearchaeota archaeon]